jgi:hypothetical protein
MSKNNLDHLIIKKTSVLPKPKSKAGRPTTNPNEKESETIALKITPLELSISCLIDFLYSKILSNSLENLSGITGISLDIFSDAARLIFL